MKKNLFVLLTVLAVPPLLLTSFLNPPQDEYIVIGWNDLGMHCANQNFETLVILPPYNNLKAQAILKGNTEHPPQVITSGYTINYSVPGNTYSVGKTNFWDYEDVLFGVSLPDNIGLTGAGLTGSMNITGTHFAIEGIPVTPFQDDNLTTEDPYQLAFLELFDDNGLLLASTQPVIPVSNEIGCVSSGCHTSEHQILNMHEDVSGFNPNNTPILCANCHADVALGMPGIPEAGSLSEVIHDYHKEKTNNCYKCHPGENTQCFRGVMHEAGMVCQDCHGNMEQVANSIKNGRRPWLDEPKCGDCHGAQYAEEPGKLFRESKGHGGLYCSACHGSPHAILPSTEPRDNVQNIAIQGYAGTLQECVACHGLVPQGPGPHGITAPGGSSDATLSDLSVDGMTVQGFDPQVLNYTYELPEGTTQVPTISAIPNHPAASFVINAAITLPGFTSVVVTAEDGSTTLAYTVEFIILSGCEPLAESFEYGVPLDDFTGSFLLPSGEWRGDNIRSHESGYSGKSIRLRKESNSSLETPSLNGAGTLSFQYVGDESRKAVFKVEKSVDSGPWTIISSVYYRKGNWKLYTAEINDPSPYVRFRISITSAQKSNLFIDEYAVSCYQQSQPNGSGGYESGNGTKLEIGEATPDPAEAKIYSRDGLLYIQLHHNETPRAMLTVYDLSGRQVHNEMINAMGTTIIPAPDKPGAYIVSIRISNEVISRKVFIY